MCCVNILQREYVYEQHYPMPARVQYKCIRKYTIEVKPVLKGHLNWMAIYQTIRLPLNIFCTFS